MTCEVAIHINKEPHSFHDFNFIGNEQIHNISNKNGPTVADERSLLERTTTLFTITWNEYIYYIYYILWPQLHDTRLLSYRITFHTG